MFEQPNVDLGLPSSGDMVKRAVKSIVAKKEAALAGYIAWVAMQDPRSYALSREHMSAVFGEWVNRTPTIEQRGQSFVVVG